MISDQRYLAVMSLAIKRTNLAKWRKRCRGVHVENKPLQPQVVLAIDVAPDRQVLALDLNLQLVNSAKSDPIRDVEGAISLSRMTAHSPSSVSVHPGTEGGYGS